MVPRTRREGQETGGHEKMETHEINPKRELEKDGKEG